MDDIKKAFEIALNAHKGAVDKGGNDYIFHPVMVALNCKTKNEKIVALLHDVIEDTNITLEDLKKDFSDIIINAVDAITRKKGESRNDYILRVKADPISRRVKIADLKHNSDLTRIKYPTIKDIERVKKYKEELKILKKKA